MLGREDSQALGQIFKAMTDTQQPIQVIGGGLAGTEAAWQIAQAGLPVVLHEMRPHRTSPAHHTEHLAELVCSNSFGAIAPPVYSITNCGSWVLWSLPRPMNTRWRQEGRWRWIALSLAKI
jgi:heterodisulfide reductase subunit A-like polyferredoxin